jgi:hypothetical protein
MPSEDVSKIAAKCLIINPGGVSFSIIPPASTISCAELWRKPKSVQPGWIILQQFIFANKNILTAKWNAT